MLLTKSYYLFLHALAQMYLCYKTRHLVKLSHNYDRDPPTDHVQGRTYTPPLIGSASLVENCESFTRYGAYNAAIKFFLLHRVS